METSMITTATLEKAQGRDLEELYRDLHTFGIDLREASIRFQDLVRRGGFKERGQTYRYDTSDPNHALNRSIDITRNFEFLVAMTGAFSSGKSTLLNLLLDRPSLLPSSVIPLTAVCTVLRYGQEPRCEVRYVSLEEAFERVPVSVGTPFKKPFTSQEHVFEALESPEQFVDGSKAQESLQRFARVLRRFDEITARPVPFAQREPYIAGGGILSDDSTASGYKYFRPTPSEEQLYQQAGGDMDRWVTREWLALIRDVTIWVPSPLLENNIVLLDLPGLNCREDYHRRAIQHYCNMADCILVTAFQPGNQADEDVLSNFKRLSSNFADKIFFAFNKIDQFGAEPEELVRAVDYFSRDTVGHDFPKERFFLTSGHMAKSFRENQKQAVDNCHQLAKQFESIRGNYPGLDEWIDHLADAQDPGGVGYLRNQLFDFLITDAYPTKLEEIIHNYQSTLNGIIGAAEPTYEESLRLDASDLLRKSVLDYFRHVVKLHKSSLYRFRYEYLRGNKGRGSLREDLKLMLERIHNEIIEIIRKYFDQPILSAPLRDDPVLEFDLQRIADEASENLRKSLQEHITTTVHGRVMEVFRQHLSVGDLNSHLKNLFAGSSDTLRRLEMILERFEETALHSMKCIIRNGFFYMPRGRELKRLERTVPLADLKDLLVEVFADFYPAWIYENIYGAILENLWLSLFLDSEDLEQEFANHLSSAESVITGHNAAEKVVVPKEITNGSQDQYRTIRMCQELDDLVKRRSELENRLHRIGVGL